MMGGSMGTGKTAREQSTTKIGRRIGNKEGARPIGRWCAAVMVFRRLTTFYIMGVQTGGPVRAGGNTLSVNPPNPTHKQLGDWALSFVAIWDQHLTAEEMKTASDALMEYLATGRRILEAPAAAADAKPCSTVSGVTSTTIMTAEGATSTTTITTIPCPEEAD